MNEVIQAIGGTIVLIIAIACVFPIPTAFLICIGVWVWTVRKATRRL